MSGNSTPIPQTGAPTPMMNFRPPWVDQIFAKLASLEARMSKIDKIDVIEAKITTIDTSVSNLCKRMTNIEKTNGSLGNTTDELKRHIGSLTARLDESAEQYNKLSERLEDLQCHSMRDNLLFFGLKERRDRGREDCIDMIDQFCANELQFEDSVTPNIDRAHRVGRYTSGKIGPIVVKFNDYKVREAIRTSSHLLRDTCYGIQEQFPKNVRDRRRALIPIMNEARRNGER